MNVFNSVKSFHFANMQLNLWGVSLNLSNVSVSV